MENFSPVNRRYALKGSVALALSAFAAKAIAAPTLFSPSINATELGVRPDAPEDQSAALQRAIDQAARLRAPLFIPPGNYRGRDLRLTSYSNIIGIRGATRLVLSQRTSLLSADRADHVSISGLVLDGADLSLPQGRALVQLTRSENIEISECEIFKAGGTGIALEKVSGIVRNNKVFDTADTAIHSLDATRLIISGNVVNGAGNNGIRVWRSAIGPDGTIVADNRIEEIRSDAGGDGPNGNAINIFRAGNVTIRGNHIRKAAFSAVRGNSASNLQIIGNTCSELGEVALYAEFGFQGALIANNIVDGAVVGISVTNFNEGGRLAVVQGNILRNLGSKSDPSKGIGIGIEADTIVSGNVIEKAPMIGIGIGYGPYLRDVSVTGNIVREAGIGVAVSVAPKAGSAIIKDNLITGSKSGAVIGMEWEKVVTGDLSQDGAAKYPQLTISGNRTR